MTKPFAPEDGGGDDGGDRIVEEALTEALSRRYLAYALSTITTSRLAALPDVRDGLKPVQRRVLYAMNEMRLNPETSARKCAKVVGEVMGGYHPHGDTSIYDTLVRMAQEFAQRYRLVDGQGNFGNIDGDSAAAMRYTECKLTQAATLLLDGLDEGTRSTSAQLTTIRTRSRSVRRRTFRTCSPTGRRGSRSAWPRRSRRTTPRS